MIQNDPLNLPQQILKTAWRPAAAPWLYAPGDTRKSSTMHNSRPVGLSGGGSLEFRSKVSQSQRLKVLWRWEQRKNQNELSECPKKQCDNMSKIGTIFNRLEQEIYFNSHRISLVLFSAWFRHVFDANLRAPNEKAVIHRGDDLSFGLRVTNHFPNHRNPFKHPATNIWVCRKNGLYHAIPQLWYLYFIYLHIISPSEGKLLIHHGMDGMGYHGSEWLRLPQRTNA